MLSLAQEDTGRVERAGASQRVQVEQMIPAYLFESCLET